MRSLVKLFLFVIIAQFLVLPTLSARASSPKPFRGPVNPFTEVKSEEPLLVPLSLSSPIRNLAAKGTRGQLEDSATPADGSKAQSDREVFVDEPTPDVTKKTTKRSSSVICKWWFWTLLTAGLVGAGVGICAAAGCFRGNTIHQTMNVHGAVGAGQ